jgi:hypothetical protein
VTREELEEQIAEVSKDIDICNRKIAKVSELTKERDRLRAEFQRLIAQLEGKAISGNVYLQ